MPAYAARGERWCWFGGSERERAAVVAAASADPAAALNTLAPDPPARASARPLRIGAGRLRHARDVRRDLDARMAPQRVRRRQWLGIGHIEHGLAQPARVERRDEVLSHELRPAPHVD